MPAPGRCHAIDTIVVALFENRSLDDAGVPACRSTTCERVSDGTRTHDRLDHNQELYQLSYAHRGTVESTSGRAGRVRETGPPRLHSVGGDH
jgi:hypothetical protein